MSLLGLWPYLAVALLGAAIGGYATHKADSVPYARLQAQDAAFRVQVAQDSASAEKAAREALQAQIAEHQKTEAHNETVMAGLRTELGASVADLSFARRLLVAAQKGRALPGDPALPEAHGGPNASGTPPASGGGSLVTDLGAAAAEVRQCFATLKALQDEVKPQL